MHSLRASCVVCVFALVGVGVVALPACRLISEGIACDPDNPATCPTGTVCNGEAVCVSGDGASIGGPVCGDGVINGAEVCDFILDGDACNFDCTVAACGDGKLSPAEVCDDNNESGDDGCAADCLTLEPAPFCGDGDNAGEPCDASDTAETRFCNADCTLSECGDGITGPDEQCDEGPAVPLRGLDGVNADATFEIDDDVTLPSRNWTGLSGRPKIVDRGNGVLISDDAFANYKVQYDTGVTVQPNAAYTVHIDMGFASSGSATTTRFQAEVGVVNGDAFTPIATTRGSVTSIGEFTTDNTAISGSVDFSAITGANVGAGTVVVRWQQLENPGPNGFFGIDNVSVVQSSAFCRPSGAPNGCSIARCGDGIVDLNEQCDGGAACTLQCAFASACRPGGSGCFAVSFELDNGTVADGDGPFDTDVVDFDNDGDLDIVSTNRSPSGVGVALNNRGTAFATPLLSASTGRNTILQAVADYDNDGQLDIAVQGDNQISLFFGLGAGMLSVQSELIASGDDPRDFVAGDIDNDGLVDDCVGASRNFNGSHPFVSNGGRENTLDRRQSVPSGGPVGAVAVALGDFDGDGAIDTMLLSDGFVSPGVGDSLLTFQRGLPSAFENSVAATVRLGQLASTLDAGDADADSHLDVVIATETGPLVAFGDGTGQLPTLVQLPGAVSKRAAFSDFDGDGVFDVIAIEGAVVAFYRGQGDRTFAAPFTRALVENANSFALGDVDGDSLNDVVVTHPASSRYTVLVSRPAR